MNWVMAISILVSAFAAGMIWFLRRMGAAQTRLPVTAYWIEELTIDRYRPMVRLLDLEDSQFLQSQPGYTPEMANRLRARRSQMFLGYLRCLDADFQRVSMAIRILMAQSGRDRPDLARLLVQQRILFAWGMASAHLRLLLYRWGYCAVDATNLVQTFDSMRRELRLLLPAVAATEA